MLASRCRAALLSLLLASLGAPATASEPAVREWAGLIEVDGRAAFWRLRAEQADGQPRLAYAMPSSGINAGDEWRPLAGASVSADGVAYAFNHYRRTGGPRDE